TRFPLSVVPSATVKKSLGNGYRHTAGSRKSHGQLPGTQGHVQSDWQTWLPPHDEPGGSHCSPGSTELLPQRVVDVVVVVVVVVGQHGPYLSAAVVGDGLAIRLHAAADSRLGERGAELADDLPVARRLERRVALQRHLRLTLEET